MKVQKLTLENVEKIKNETDNRLVSRVCRYIISNWDYHDNKKDIFLNVMNDGCKSGACHDLICYGQTKRFYEDYENEINELLVNLLKDCGCESPSKLFGDNWDNTDPLAREEHNQNLLAWFAFKETMWKVASEFDIW